MDLKNFHLGYLTFYPGFIYSLSSCFLELLIFQHFIYSVSLYRYMGTRGKIAGQPATNSLHLPLYSLWTLNSVHLAWLWGLWSTEPALETFNLDQAWINNIASPTVVNLYSIYKLHFKHWSHIIILLSSFLCFPCYRKIRISQISDI